MCRKKGIQLSHLHCGLQPLSIENDSALYFLSSAFHKVQHCHSYLLFPCACLKHSCWSFFCFSFAFWNNAVVQLPSHVRLFVTPWTAALQTSLSLTISQSLLKFMSIPLVMPSSHLILWGPLLLLPLIFPTIRVFSNELVFASGGQNIGASASASVLPMSIQGWFPLKLTSLISLLSKGLSRVFYSTTVQRHQFFSTLPSLTSRSHNCTWPLEKA